MVIPANGPHLLQEQIERVAGRRVLSMIAVTLEEIQRRQWRKVGVLGFGNPMVYTKPLGGLHIAYETLDGELRADLDWSIMHVMEGRDDAKSPTRVKGAIEVLRAGRHNTALHLTATRQVSLDIRR